jgi:hypothetical protein
MEQQLHSLLGLSSPSTMTSPPLFDPVNVLRAEDLEQEHVASRVPEQPIHEDSVDELQDEDSPRKTGVAGVAEGAARTKKLVPRKNGKLIMSKEMSDEVSCEVAKL